MKIKLIALALGLTVFATGNAAAEVRQVQAYSPPPAKEGYSYPDCYCTDSAGQRIEMGQYACLQIGSRQVLARCEMSLNNPTWRHQEGGCPGV